MPIFCAFESHCHLDLGLYLQGWQCRHLDIFNIIQRLVHWNRVLTAHTVRLQVVWWDEFPQRQFHVSLVSILLRTAGHKVPNFQYWSPLPRSCDSDATRFGLGRSFLEVWSQGAKLCFLFSYSKHKPDPLPHQAGGWSIRLWRRHRRELCHLSHLRIFNENVSNKLHRS